MDTNKVSEVNLKIVESQRIAEIKSLSYVERLERLMIIIEVSYTLRIANGIPFKRNIFLITSKTLNNKPNFHWNKKNY